MSKKNDDDDVTPEKLISPQESAAYECTILHLSDCVTSLHLYRQQQELLHAASHPSLVPHVGVLTSLIEFMNKRLELTVSGDLSVEKTMEVIERGISAFIARDPPETVKAAEQSAISVPEKMRYEEQPESEDFFRPYTWEVIYVHTVRDLHWLPTTQVLNSSSSQPTS